MVFADKSFKQGQFKNNAFVNEIDADRSQVALIQQTFQKSMTKPLNQPLSPRNNERLNLKSEQKPRIKVVKPQE